MHTQTLRDGDEDFTVSVHRPPGDGPVVLFAVGSGGQPQRHGTLLDTLAAAGCTVVAPHFARLAAPPVREPDLLLRARRLSLALDACLPPGAPALAVGHSIGAATLLALAGGQMWLGPGRPVAIPVDARLTRLALLACPTGFFQAPGGLDGVQLPILAWVGSADEVTPPDQSRWLARALEPRCPVDLRITEGAGHFSCMDLPPPGTTEPLAGKAAFLEAQARDVCRFLLAPAAA